MLFVMVAAALSIRFGLPCWHLYAPAWGEPEWTTIDSDVAEVEARYWTGRRERVYIPPKP